MLVSQWAILGLICVAVLLLAAIYFEVFRQPIGPRQQANAPGDLAQLSQGVTHFAWSGPVRGPVAVVVHGINTPMAGNAPLVAAMGAMGYRVLSYDLYGRGLSDAPKGQQDQAFFLRQLDDLLAHQDLTDELTLVGYSMGGSIVTAFAAAQPHRVNRVILLATTGAAINEPKFWSFCRRVPVWGDLRHAFFARRALLRAIPRRAATPALAQVHAAQRAAVSRRGYLPALLSSRRGLLTQQLEAEHRKLYREDVPVIAVWAEHDALIPQEAQTLLAEWNPQIRQKLVKGADHAMPYTHPETVIAALRQALRG